MNASYFFTHCRRFRELNFYLVHSDVVHSGSWSASLSICFRFIVSRSFYCTPQIRFLFFHSPSLFFFFKREDEENGWKAFFRWKARTELDMIMMILIIMILITRGGPGKSNANNNHLLSAVECIFGLFDAIIILLPTITNKP